MTRPDVHARIIGIDPGAKGAFVTLVPIGNTEPRWGIAEIHHYGASSGWQNNISLAAGALRQIHHKTGGLSVAILEQVHSRPRDGHVGAFSFGQNYGQWLGMLYALQIPIILAPPDVWTAVMGLTLDKTEHRRRAATLWPSEARRFRKVSDDGVADAALLALYGTRFLPGGGYNLADHPDAVFKSDFRPDLEKL
jgi:hypothetical protein